MNVRERLVRHVQALERLEEAKQAASEALANQFKAAKEQGYDTATLRVVLKLRKLTPSQRRERKALEAIYMAALGMLDGEALPDEARRRLDPEPELKEPRREEEKPSGDTAPPTELPPPMTTPQPTLALKEPAEAKQEGVDAARAGKRIYDNPYPAGDPCRAAWDEGWCSQRKSHGMDVPKAYQRRESPTPPKKRDDDKDRDGEAA